MFLLKSDFKNGKGPIFGYKYHYAKFTRVGVNIWFSPNFESICWKQANKFVKSSAKVSEITGIMFGPFSSTF